MHCNVVPDCGVHAQCIGPLCYDFSLLDEYLSQPQVREVNFLDTRCL